MKNVNKFALGIAFMLFVGLISNSNSAYAQRCYPGNSVGFNFSGIGISVDDFGVRIQSPRLNIDTRSFNRNPYSRYQYNRHPRFDYRNPCPPNYPTYPRYDYGYPRYSPSYPPTYPRFDYRNQHNSRQYQEQLRRQREAQERLRREQERYQRNMERILRDLRRDCR